MIRPVEALVAIVLVAAIMAVASAMTAARGDDRFPWTERPAPIVHPVDEVSSRKRTRRYRSGRPRVPKAAPAAVPFPPERVEAAPVPVPVDPFPFPLIVAPPATPSRFDAAFAAVAEAPIVPKSVRTVSFRMPVKPPPKPPEPRLPVFVAALVFAAVCGLVIFAAAGTLIRTPWQRLKRPAKAPPRNVVYLTTRGRKVKIA